MSAVIYKQRSNKVYLSDTPNKNAEHIRYIGTRPGAMRNAGQTHGLFGNIYNPNTLEVNTKIKEVMELVRQKSNEKKNIFKSVISFSAENAALKVGNPITKEAWQEFVKQQLRIIAEGNNIKMSNLRWVAAAHDTPDHPHVHIVFWDDSQEIQKNWVNPKIPDKIRINLTKNIFEDELKEFHEQKSQALVRMKDITNDMVLDFEKYLKDMSASQYRDFSNNPYDFEGQDRHITEFLASKLFELRKEIPKGALKFAYQPKEVKEKLISLVRELVDMDENLQEAVQAYVKSKLNEAGLYKDINKELGSLTEKYTREAEEKIANSVLKLIKKFSQKEWEISSHEKRVQYAEQLLTEIFASLTKLSQQDRKASRSHKHIMGGDMSKQARKEKAKELEDTGWDIER